VLSYDNNSFGVVMIFLRLACFFVGCGTLFLAPFIVVSETHGPLIPGLNDTVASMLMLVIFVFPYFFLAALEKRTIRQLKMRVLAALLMLAQFAVGGWVLASELGEAALIAVGVLMSLSVFLFMMCVWPGVVSSRSRRPLRERGPEDHYTPS
jgi:hypothetical protein